MDETQPSTSGISSLLGTKIIRPNKRKTLSDLEIEKELDRLDAIYADSDSACSESDEEVVYASPRKSENLQRLPVSLMI